MIWLAGLLIERQRSFKRARDFDGSRPVSLPCLLFSYFVVHAGAIASASPLTPQAMDFETFLKNHLDEGEWVFRVESLERPDGTIEISVVLTHDPEALITFTVEGNQLETYFY